MLRIRREFRSEIPPNRSSNAAAQRRSQLFSKQKLRDVAHVMGPTMVALAFAGVSSGVAHAQGTMDFSGAQTLMGTFKTFAAFLRRADEGTLSRLLVESSILLAASRGDPSAVLKDAATAYKVDTDALAAKVRQEFTAKEKARKTAQPAVKAAKKVA
jgi:hypothetical protein